MYMLRDFMSFRVFTSRTLHFSFKYSIIFARSFMEYVIYLIASFFAVTIVLTLHEFSHAFVAVRCGDPTPRTNGRLTLNPIAHFDILGLIMFTFAGFGWAKPVPINPYNFNHWKRGLFLTAIAGVVMNYITAFLFYPLFMLVVTFVNTQIGALDFFLYYLTYDLFLFSLSFCVFNLIPLPPLDGWRVVQSLNRRQGKVYQFFERSGHIILLILILIHYLASMLSSYEMFALAGQIFSYIDILGYILTFVVNIVGWPITALWGLVF